MTIDPFVLLAPVLVLAVVALLRFVGCNQVYGLEPTTLAPSQPVLSDISPMFETERDPGFTLIVTGGNFVNGTPGMQSVVQWNGSNRDTAFKSATELWAAITAADIATPGTATVTVFTPDASPDTTSNGKTFTINSSDVTVTFSPDPTPMPGALPDPYENLVFETTKWAWEPGNLDDPANHIYFVFPETQGTITFVNGPRLLKSMIASADYRGGQMTVDDTINPTQNPTQSLTFPLRTMGTPGTPQLLTLNWTMKSTTVTVKFAVSGSLVIDTITYQGPP